MYSHAQHRTILDHPWRIAALVAVIANITFSYVNGHIGPPLPSVAEVSNHYSTLFTPASYAFAIWGVIYASTLLYGVLAILPTQLDVRLHDRVAPWLLLINALGSLWISLFTLEQLGPSVLIILAMLASAVVMYSITTDHLVSENLSRWWRVPFALWLGWLAVASIANLNLALSAAGWNGWPLSPALWTSLLLGLAAWVALATYLLYFDPVVPLVVGWAAAAIAVAHFEESTLVGIVATVVAIKTLYLGARVLLFNLLPTLSGRAQVPRRVVMPRDWSR
jgi:benzodiazapine receptor